MLELASSDLPIVSSSHVVKCMVRTHVSLAIDKVCDVLRLVGVPIFRLLLKIAVGVAHKVASFNFCGPRRVISPTNPTSGLHNHTTPHSTSTPHTHTHTQLPTHACAYAFS